TTPPSGASRPIMQRATVDLPQPDSPTRAKLSPFSTEKDTSSMARTGGRALRSKERGELKYFLSRSTLSSVIVPAKLKLVHRPASIGRRLQGPRRARLAGLRIPAGASGIAAQ